MKILIVEDDEMVREMIGALLQAIRDKHPSLPLLHIYVAENGAIGGQKALEHEIDLVLTDCLMERMDGLTMTRAIRRSGFTAPVVMMDQPGPREAAGGRGGRRHRDSHEADHLPRAGGHSPQIQAEDAGRQLPRC